MIKSDYIFENFQIKKRLDSAIDVLVAEEIIGEEYQKAVMQVAKELLPNASENLLTIIYHYAKEKHSLYCYEKILNESIMTYKRG